MTKSIAWRSGGVLGLACILALAAGHGFAAENSPPKVLEHVELAPIPAPVTSFGAALLDGRLYIYGGNLGSAHDYTPEVQSKELTRLDLAANKWSKVAEGPRRISPALVAHGGKLYRLGGFEARRSHKLGADGKPRSTLHSMPDFARFDPATGKWQDLTPLPRGRSSHDMAVLGSKLYVFGGWELGAPGGEDWHKTCYVCDLDGDEIKWQPLPDAPFFRRAVAVAAYDDKLYVIGGMDDVGSSTTKVDIYDPAAKTWSTGPSVPGQPIDGFGCSAYGTRHGLYVSTVSGGLYRLAKGDTQWAEIAQLKHPRSFHRLVATDDGTIYVLGGTHPKTGKVASVEKIRLELPR